jgi:hypothetical protein
MGLQVIQYIPMILNEIFSIFWLIVVDLYILLSGSCKYMLVFNLEGRIASDLKLILNKRRQSCFWLIQYNGHKIANENDAGH